MLDGTGNIAKKLADYVIQKGLYDNVTVSILFRYFDFEVIIKFVNKLIICYISETRYN